jgi:AcrR family transcriptional regulator
MRRDAARNREALLDAAVKAFRAEGLEIGVDEIARRSGVSVATLYRHFPTKTDLIYAVTELVVDELSGAADVALAGAPEDALRHLMTAATAQQRENRGFLDALARQTLPMDLRRALTARIIAMLEPVTTVAHAAGTLHESLDAGDVLVAIRMAGVTGTGLEAHPPEHYVALLLGGLRHPG